MKAKLQKFMAGRYGVDDLSRFCGYVTIALLLLGMLYSGFYFLGIILLVYQYFRVFSRDVLKREGENYVFLQYKRRVTAWLAYHKSRITQRKTHHFFKCPSCSQRLRVPKGKGKIAVTCPKCHTRFYKDS